MDYDQQYLENLLRYLQELILMFHLKEFSSTEYDFSYIVVLSELTGFPDTASICSPLFLNIK